MVQAEPTLFMVDDDVAVLDAISTMARILGIKSKVYASAHEFLRDYDCGEPGCLLVDIRMPDMTGFELQAALPERGVHLPVVFITGHADVSLAVRAIKTGAIDFLEKPFQQQKLLDCIRCGFEVDARRREKAESAMLLGRRYETLTPRERQVMQLLVEGQFGKQIAAELSISYKTVEKFRSRVMKKMETRSIAELVLMAMNLNLFTGKEAAKREF